MTEQTAESTTPKAPARTTDYVVLESVEAGSEVDWTVIHGPIMAVNAKAAVSAVLKLKDGEVAGTYVAVPARSWHPITVAVEVQQKLKFA